MSTVLIVIVAVLVLLAVGGFVARRRQLAAGTDRFLSHLDKVNSDLASARAGDRGWDPARMEAAARAGWSGATPDSVELWRVVDMPGTDADQAEYRIRCGDEEAFVLLGRRGDEWLLV